MPDCIVLDASAAAKLFQDETDADALRDWHAVQRIAGASLAAPSLLAYELGQVLACNVKDRGAQKSLLEDALLGVELSEEALASGFDHRGLTFYDASYLALAKARTAVLVSYDDKLLKAAKSAGIPVLSPGAR